MSLNIGKDNNLKLSSFYLYPWHPDVIYEQQTGNTIDQIPAELIKAGGRTICGEIRKLITSIWKKEILPEVWKESIIVPIHKKGDKTDCSNRQYCET